MSAWSPRGSLSGASSAEVADDFGESLKDLQMNNRYEISNLTIIAKENTEHAQAISKTLEGHIKTTSPSRKLPALYVLDSIVKNVGTPYTVYLGRNLYSTFMEAYTLVDSATRRSMDAMLKTWKEAVPGAMDPRPVFPPETVRPIENALIRARTAALQSQRQVQSQPGYRNTPTPPQHNGQFLPPPPTHVQAQVPPFYSYGNQMPTPQPQRNNAPVFQAQHPSQQPPYPFAPPNHHQPPPGGDVEGIKRDVAGVISQRQAQFAVNPFDQGVRQQLDALLKLQTILNTQLLSQSDLDSIRKQVSVMSATATATATAPAAANPTPQPPAAPPQWQQQPLPPPPSVQPVAAYSQPPSVQQTPSAAPLLTPAALSGLQALLANAPKPGTPQMRAAAPALQNASHAQLNNVQNQVAAAPTLNGADLIASLSKNGLLAGLPRMPSFVPPAAAPPPAAPAVTAATAAQPQSTAAILQSLQGILPPPTSQGGTPPTVPHPQPANIGRPRLPMTAASLKASPTDLVRSLYEAQPNQCNTCGRRFRATADGRGKKERHLDWHFRTNQRMADPNVNRGRHRNWFVTEIEWVRLREFDPSTTTAADAANANANTSSSASFSSSSSLLLSGPGQKSKAEAAAAASSSSSPGDQYVRAPAGVTRNTCPICLEDMKSSYHDALQDWVFTDAVRGPGGRIVHASCLADLHQTSPSSSSSLPPAAAVVAAAAGLATQARRQRSATPESTRLGKRNADGVLVGVAGGIAGGGGIGGGGDGGAGGGGGGGGAVSRMRLE